MMEGLAAPQASERTTVMIDATYLKVHRTASSFAKKRGRGTPDRMHERRHEHQAPCRDGYQWSADQLLYDRRSGQRLHRCGGLAGRTSQSQWRLADRGDAD
ncbi:hypothetical protein [Sphingobium amiense]|uniref:hypothetical protein n=1 Tax=Sphingobium amiense TaxID=135719 RepID=UPI00350E36F5